MWKSTYINSKIGIILISFLVAVIFFQIFFMIFVLILNINFVSQRTILSAIIFIVGLSISLFSGILIFKKIYKLLKSGNVPN